MLVGFIFSYFLLVLDGRCSENKRVEIALKIRDAHIV